MKTELLLILFLTLATYIYVDGAFVWNYLRGGSGIKSNQILPVDRDKTLEGTAPATPVSEKRAEAENGQVLPLIDDYEDEFYLEVPPKFNMKVREDAQAEKKRGIMSMMSNWRNTQEAPMTSKERLQTMLKKYQITEGFDSLSEMEAAALCEIKRFLRTVLDPAQRNKLLLVHHNNNRSKHRQITHRHFDFTDQIGKLLADVRDLKGFLRVVLKYYYVCFHDLMFDTVQLAIMKSQVLSLEELMLETRLEPDELFWFACLQGDLTSAKNILKSIEFRVDIVYSTVMAAFDAGKCDLVKGLLGTIKEYYEMDESGIYQKLVTETLDLCKK